jgi:hypothetical protein
MGHGVLVIQPSMGDRRLTGGSDADQEIVRLTVRHQPPLHDERALEARGVLHGEPRSHEEREPAHGVRGIRQPRPRLIDAVRLQALS